MSNERHNAEKAKHLGYCKKIYAPDDRSVSILVSMDTPQKVPNLPEDILEKLKHIGQSVELRADLGTSISELLDEDKPIIE
jgi:hypothetical protein